MRIVLTGGGTGGHVIPNIAVIEELRKNKGDLKLLYIGSKEGMEKKMIKDIGMRYEGVHCGKLRRYFSWLNFVDFFKVPVGVVQARRILKKFKPDVVFSKGGFVSMPATMAAFMLRIPVIVHESDLVPGLANKTGFRFAKKICLGFERTREHLSNRLKEKVAVIGTPVREETFEGSKARGYDFTGFSGKKPVLLVMGGSQGAAQINEVLRSSLDQLLEKFQIVHLAGRGTIDLSMKREGYKQYEYLGEELKDVYAISDLVVTRGGANTLYELALLKKKAVVIPLMRGSRGDQLDNARFFGKEFGWKVLEGEFDVEDFVEAVDEGFKEKLLESEKIKNAREDIVELILRIGKGDY